MKLNDILCPPLADMRRIRATSYWLKEEVKVLGRRIERLHGQLGHARSVEEVFLQLAAQYPQIMEELRDGALCVDCGAHAGHVSEVLLRLGRPVTLLKLDIEGAEYEVLESLITRGVHELCRHILVETHHQKVSSLAPRAAALEQLLRDREVKNVYLDWV